MEPLDERLLPAVTGLPWPEPGRITLSFAPDGADVGGAPSTLSATLAAFSSPSDASWRTTVLRAFQSWAASAAVDIAVVDDDGRPFGSPGPAQGDPGVGDVRLSARPLADGTLALSEPFDLFDSWSGDVVLNSDAPFGDGKGGTRDLFGAVLHEAGHVFGLDENPGDPASAMYPRLIPGRTGPSAADVARLVALYGPRQTGSSGSTLGLLPYLSKPSDLSGAGLSGKVAPAADGEVTGPADRDTYVIVVPLTAGGSFSVNVRAAGISLLTGKLTVLDPLGQVVGQAVSTDPLSNDLTVNVPAGMRGAVLFARVESAGADAGVFGVGKYRIAAGAPALAASAAAPTRGMTDDGGQNDRISRATELKPQSDLSRPGWPYTVRATVASPAEGDFYKVRTDRSPSPFLLVTAWGLNAGGLAPRVDLFDRFGRPVPGQLLHHDGSSYTIQVPQVEPNAWLYVRVGAIDPAGARATGDYFVGLSPRATPIPLLPFTDGTLDQARAQDFRTFNVYAPRLFHFDLTSTGGAADALVRATFYDASRRPVLSFNTASGSAEVFLPAGTYTVRFVGGTRSGAPLPLTLFQLRGLIRSEPIGPGLVDTTGAPATPEPDSAPTDDYDWGQDDYLTYIYYLTLTDIGALP